MEVQTTIKFRFQPAKAVETAASFLKLHGQPMKASSLLKLLYLADRFTLELTGQPITGDRYVSMDDGPVLSGVYDLLQGKPVDDALTLWSQYIASGSEAQVYLLSDPGNAELCEEEEAIIQQVYQAFGQRDPFDVTKRTQDFPEWEDPHGSTLPILVESVLKSMGKSDEEIEAIRQEASREAYLDTVLGGW